MNAENIAERASDNGRRLGDAMDTVQQWQEQATETMRKAAKATDDYVRQNPWPSIGYAAIGCLVLGFILGRSRD
jgi:ElaB/YqjD/DUF883 family membrane-anchored ribosome-binding protein